MATNEIIDFMELNNINSIIWTYEDCPLPEVRKFILREDENHIILYSEDYKGEKIANFVEATSHFVPLYKGYILAMLKID